MQEMAKRMAFMAVAVCTGLALIACQAGNQATQTAEATGAAAVTTSTTTPPTEAPVSTDTPQSAAAAQTDTPAPSTQQNGTVTVTDAQATDLATQALASNPNALPVPLENPRISFTRQYMQLAADVRGQGVRLETQGTPDVENGRLVYKLNSLKLNGVEVPLYHQEVEDAINNMLAAMTAGHRVKSVQLGDGTLTIVPDV